jgi:GLPGLI family protein
MKKIILLSLASCFAILLSAQNENAYMLFNDGGNWSAIHVAPTKQQCLEKEKMEFFYDFTYLCDTIDSKSAVKDQMILQIGDSLSKYWSFTNLRIDSLLCVKSHNEIMNNVNKYHGGVPLSVYKNFSRGKMTCLDQVSTDWYRFEEDIPTFDWNLVDGSKVILGYTCQRAECNFRGRHYTAWYTTEIPVSNGPWKFGGLPGMIMEVTDSRGQYSFTMTGIAPKGHRDINLPQLKFFDTTRMKYYKLRYKFDCNPVGYMASVSNINMNIVKPDGSPDTEAMKPKKLKFGYIEMDW